MKFKLSVVGCDDHGFGEEVILFEDEQVGAVTMCEIEVESVKKLTQIAATVGTIQLSETNWERYDGELTIICGEL